MKVTAPVVSPLSSARWPGGQGPVPGDKLEATHVGAAQLQLLGQALVEVAGRAEIAHDLVPQLLTPAR